MIRILKFLIFLCLFSRGFAAFVCEGDGFYADPYDCAKFYRCHSGQVFSFSCGPGTHFNPTHSGCDWPSVVGCKPLDPETDPQQSRYQQQYNRQNNYNNQRQPQESVQTDTRQQRPQSGYQNPYDNRYEQPNSEYDRRQQPYPDPVDRRIGSQGSSDPNYGNQENYGTINRQTDDRNKVRPKPYPGNDFDHNYDQRVTERSERPRSRQKVKPQTYPEDRQTDEDISRPNYGDRVHDRTSDRQKDRVRPQQRPRNEDYDQSVYETPQEGYDEDNDEQWRRTTASYRKPQQRHRYRTSTLPTTTEDDSSEEDDDSNAKYGDRLYDRTGDRQKERTRPQQRPRNEDYDQTGYGRPQEVYEEDNDQQLRRTSPSSRKKPPPRNRFRTSTVVTTTEDKSDEEFDEFLKQFEEKKDSEEPTDDNKWFNFEDVVTTTEDPLVSMFKSKVPVRQRPSDSLRNRSGIDRNRKYGPQTVSTLATTRRRSKAKTTTTLDPFQTYWNSVDSESDNNGKSDDSIQSSADLNFKRKPFKEDPLLMPDLISYFNCTEAGKSCNTCKELDWIKYSGIALKAVPFRSFKFHTKIVSKQCYKACSDSQQCIAFSYSLTTGMCHIYDQMTTDDMNTNKEYNSVVQNPKSDVLREEWVHTKNGFITGKELSSSKSDNVISCLRKCIKDNDNCQAISYDLVQKVCKLFDENEGFSVNTLKANSIAVQHLSIFDDKNQWRFEDIGYQTLNNSEALNTIPVNENEECFYECLENSDNNCTYVTIEENKESNDNEVENNSKLCHLFGFLSVPKWIESEDKINKSYILNVPKNHSRVQRYPGYSYVGNPVEILNDMTEDECRQYAEEKCTFCRKYTAIIETKECALFSDSALLSPSISETNYTEKSGIISMPKDKEYLAFKRIPWKMFVTDITPYELKGEIDGHKCVKFCFQQKQCVATALVYDTADSSLFCYFFKEQDLENTNTTEYENVDLFIKIHEQNEIPGHMKNRSDDCSDGEPLDDAVKNVNDLDGNMDIMSQNFDDNAYNSNSDPISPHGYNYYGGPVEGNSNKDSRKQNIRHSRDVSNQNDFEPTQENSDPNENGLSFVNSVKQSTKKRRVLDRIPTISSELRKAAKKKRLETQSEKSSGKLSKNCESVNDFDFESNDNECIDSKSDDSDKCTEIPSIIYSDIKQMNSCRDSPIDDECEVICRSGYEPNEQKIKCEKSGNRNIWKSKHIKCSPIESNCEEVNNDKNSTRIKASTKYPEEKLHYILRYDKSKKLPQFSIYIHTKENNVKETEPTNTFNKNSCKLLNGQQLTKSDYKKSDYNPKPLLPQNAFLYSNEAQTVNNYFPNTAPQDPFTSRGPWSTIENRTLEMLKSRPGIVINGVCPQTIKNEVKNKNQTLNIPECFWSIVCVPFDNGVTAAVFYAENTHPISQLEKQSRVDQIRQYRDQRFVVKLLGTDLYRNVWYETYNAFKDANKGIKPFISKCAQTSYNTPEAIGFWDNVIKGDNSGQKWQSVFSYGLEKSDEQLKNSNKSKSLDNQNLVSGKRSADQSVPEDRLVSDNFVDEEEAVTDNECENKIIGYITSWGNRSFTVNEGSLLTHAIYAYVHMDSKGNLGPFNAELNENRVMFTKLYEMLSVKTKLLDKNQYLKTMVSFGGWNNSDHFSSVIASPEYRNNFILDALNIIDYWSLEGIEIDWKYPVIGGSKVGQESDRENFVTFLQQIRQAFSAYEKGKGRTEPLLLSITGASGYWLIDESYDLENIIPLVDWINVLTYDYFGPWKSKWGANTGPNAPLYASAPIDSLSKMNIHSTIEQYFCRVNSTDKLVMSIPFYGHYWNDVGEPIDTQDNHFRDAHPVGGFVTYSNIKDKWLSNRDFQQLMHNKSFTPYLWSEFKRVLLSYENSKSIENKIKYAIDHKLGGVSVWAIDFDDNENELLNTIVENYKSCSSGDDNTQSENSFKCNSYEKKWWTNEDGPNARLCGRSAPLINGFYPVCDPESQTMSCCSSWGRCGSGPQFCECEGCVDYKRSPELIMREPLKPNQEIRWLTTDKQPNGDQNEDTPICGYKAQLLNGSFPICNPDDNNAHCCSANGLCGVGSQFCNCKGCVNFRKNPKFSFLKKLWWDQNDGLHKAGRCGKLAPKVNGTFAICNPYSEDAYCCGKWGFCGAGSTSCDCVSCVNFKRNPYFRWK